MKTGKLIEALMYYRHISLEEMSKATGIAQNNISTLISGRRNITPSIAKKVCKVLNIEPVVIMTNRMCEELNKKLMKLIDKDALVAEIKRRKELVSDPILLGNDLMIGEGNAYFNLLSFLDTLEVREVDLELITGWFDHIAQIADDRMTLTNQRMTDAHALDEIKCLAKNSSEFITKHYKAQKGE